MTHLPWKTSEWETLDAMQRYGGSFVQQLAVLYRHADPVNSLRLRDAFHDYFTEYDELAERARTPEPAA